MTVSVTLGEVRALTRAGVALKIPDASRVKSGQSPVTFYPHGYRYVVILDLYPPRRAPSAPPPLLAPEAEPSKPQPNTLRCTARRPPGPRPAPSIPQQHPILRNSTPSIHP